MKKILIASTNKGKVRELGGMLDMELEWVGLERFGDLPEVEEDGATFADNARKKALGYARATGLWTIADDSGLEIDALGGQPGVMSARFSGAAGANRKEIDKQNIIKVLSLLKGVPFVKRTARFVCRLCLASSEKVLAEAEGKVQGVIIETPRGDNGFGYDPIFYLPGMKKTVAELCDDEKNAISHRGNAVRNIKPMIEKLLAIE
jgi:XTP/dITP diphosphohydrolase